jgi:hypothetical protein
VLLGFMSSEREVAGGAAAGADVQAHQGRQAEGQTEAS